MEKMLRLIHAGRLVFAFLFIVSAWREYYDERTWLVFNLNGEEAAEEYIILGIVMKAKYIIGLGIMMKLYGGVSFLSSTYPGALILLIYQAILSPILFDLYNRGYIQFRQSYQHFLQTSHRTCEELRLRNARHRKFCDQIIEYVNETVSADNRVAMCYHHSIVQEEMNQKLCDQINEIERQASSMPLFTQSKFNTFFFPFIKGFGIVAALVFFITMKRKHGMLKKHKIN
ncbi:hypothetical protein N665_2064s0004 [Sinapis alba]|nr:hypothetical protein N665_2064s0004 [Sinapis alba]